MREINREEIKKVITEREVGPTHLLFAFYLGSVGEKGFISQGAVNVIGEYVGSRVFIGLSAMGKLKENYPNSKEGFKEFVNDLASALEITKEGAIVEFLENNIVEVRIKGSLCKFCPKGIGGAEIPGTLCIFPVLIENTAKAAGINCRLEPINGKPLVKEEGFCKMRYVIEV